MLLTFVSTAGSWWLTGTVGVSESTAAVAAAGWVSLGGGSWLMATFSTFFTTGCWSLLGASSRAVGGVGVCPSLWSPDRWAPTVWVRGFTRGGLGGAIFGLDCATGGLGFSGVTDRERGRTVSSGGSVTVGNVGDFIAPGDNGCYEKNFQVQVSY